MKLSLVVVPLALFLFLPSTLLAADLRVGRRVSVLPAETISGNLYAAGAEIVISGNLTGDLVCAGGNVYVGGTVAEEVVVTGGDLNLTGRVRKDLRVAGGRVNLSGQVDGEFLVVGGQVHILPGASVGGDLIVAGGRVIVEGPVHGSLRAAGGEITINETVAGPVRVRASSVVIGSRARLGGELTYLAPQEARIAEGAQIRGPVTFHMTAATDREWLGRALGRIGLAFLFLTFLMSLAAGLFAVLVFPKTSEELVRYTLHNFGKELLRGVVLFFVMPAALFLATLTVVGLPLAVVAGLVHFTFGIIAVVFAGIAFGSLLWKTVAKKEEYEVTWKTVFVGLPLLVLANLVPVIGLLCNAVFFLTVFGALYQRSALLECRSNREVGHFISESQTQIAWGWTMKWITRERVKVDRVACPWLIRQFIDPGAEFLFVPAAAVMERARQLGAIPFDVPPHPEAKFVHRDGKCTFEVLVEEYRISDPAVALLARIVHGADIAGEESATPQSAGLKAIAEGFAETGRDDFDRLEKEFPLYDALYAWCGKQTEQRG